MLHLACNIDHRYVRHCAVTLASAFANNADLPITAHIVGRGLTAPDREALDKVARQWPDKHICYYVPAPDLLDGFTIRATHGRITLATYYRCFLAELLPADIDRVIYLDCDLLVLQPLEQLWETPLHGSWVGAVVDTGYNETERYRRLGYPQSDSYFNAGVLLIDLAAWRTEGMGQRCCDYYNSHLDTIVYNDQDVLNGLLHDKRREIEVKWNVQDGFYRRRHSLPPTWQADHAEALRHPAILHYTNRKPWDYDSQHPLRRLYFDYLDLTPWRGQRPWHNPLNWLKRTVKLLPFRLRLRKPRYIRLSD